MELQTLPPDVTLQCGDNVTLKCEATVPSQMKITGLYWAHANKSCRHQDQRSEPTCESGGEPPQYSLALTLVNVMPVDQGKYLCKLYSTMGIYYNHSVVTVQGESIGVVSNLQPRPN